MAPVRKLNTILLRNFPDAGFFRNIIVVTSIIRNVVNTGTISVKINDSLNALFHEEGTMTIKAGAEIVKKKKIPPVKDVFLR